MSLACFWLRLTPVYETDLGSRQYDRLIGVVPWREKIVRAPQ